jgi:hypothetical protein
MLTWVDGSGFPGCPEVMPRLVGVKFLENFSENSGLGELRNAANPLSRCSPFAGETASTITAL